MKIKGHLHRRANDKVMLLEKQDDDMSRSIPFKELELGDKITYKYFKTNTYRVVEIREIFPNRLGIHFIQTGDTRKAKHIQVLAYNPDEELGEVTVKAYHNRINIEGHYGLLD